MPIETVMREAVSVAKSATRMTEKLGKKAWSVTDAAAEKKTPSDYLSQRTVKSIQGKE